jgi:hypothetical protein
MILMVENTEVLLAMQDGAACDAATWDAASTPE